MAAKMREPWEHEYFNVYVKPYLNADLQYLGEVSHAEKLQLLAGARGLLNPDPVARAVRAGDDRGHGLRHAGARPTPKGRRPRSWRTASPASSATTRPTWPRPSAGSASSTGRACRAAVEGYFSIDRMVAEHISLFEDILSR